MAHREVTCYSCHRGSIDPVATPVVMTAESKPGMAEPKETRRRRKRRRLAGQPPIS